VRARRPIGKAKGTAVPTSAEIKGELERAMERRTELWRELGRGLDPAVSDELARLKTEIEELWVGLRATRTRERFGAPEHILRRAGRDKRLERELERRGSPPGDSRRAA
jgi:hypothetical protein